MGVIAARKTNEVANNLADILAIELLASAQALEFRRPLTTSAPLEAVHAALRKRVPPYEQDRAHYVDIRAARELVESGAVLDAVAETLGKGALS